MSEDPNQKWLLKVLIDAWKAGESKQKLFLDFINWAPIIFCPLGQAWYFKSENKYGIETWWAPHNMERQPFHFLGGFILGNALGWIHPLAAGVVVFLVIGFLEFVVDLKQGKQWMKAVLDTFFWTSGSFVPSFYLKHLF